MTDIDAGQESCETVPPLVAGSRALDAKAGCLKVMQWNVLGDGTAQDEYESKHGAVDEAIVGWDARKVVLIMEIQRIDPDIILLCECNRFEEFWVGTMQALGFQGVWGAKFDQAAGIWPVPSYFRGAPSDGCAIFYSEKRFRTVWVETFRFAHGSTQLAQEALLESVTDAAHNGGIGRLLVGIAHLKASNNAPSAELRQQQARTWAAHLKEKMAAAGDDTHLVIAGDMNEPVEATETFQHVGGAVRLLEKELGVVDAYASAPPEVTSWGGRGWWCSIDNILHSRSLCPDALLALPSLKDLYQGEPSGFPSKTYPSDHISLAVSLRKAHEGDSFEQKTD